MKELSVYIHVPFCDHKCIYCDFYSIIRNDAKEEFIIGLKKEISHYSSHYSKNRSVRSVFFGGGTPSLLEPFEIAEIIDALNSAFSFCNNIEITLEANPGTVDIVKLGDFKNAGINRLSLGVQSFDDSELKFLTRIHNSTTAKKTILNAVEAGYDNISLDLIFNLPGQTKKGWTDNLNEAIKLPVVHISAYSLILEPGTILNKMVLDGKVKISNADFDADLYRTTMEFLTEHGYRQYEVSNFCKPGYECKHNLAYWKYKDYLGLGPSAHSFINGRRWWNYSALNFYLRKIEEFGNAVRGEEILTETERLEEFVMLALRSSGLNLHELRDLFGNIWINMNNDLIKELIAGGFLIEKDNLLKFTTEGYALCDEILLKFNYITAELV